MKLPPVRISDSDIEYYRRNGAVCLRNLFDESWIELLRRGVERNIANPSKFFATIRPDFIMDYNAWQLIPEYEQFVRQSPVGEIAGTLMGWREVNFFEDNLFCSSDGQSEATKWHQDSSYYEIAGSICSVWVPLDDLIAEDCITIVAGSHNWGRTFLPTSFSGKREKVCEQAPYIPDRFEPMVDVDGHLDEYEILAWSMRAGDCIALDGNVVHGKFRSDTGRSLRRITFRFVGEDAYWDKNDLPWLEMEMGHGSLEPGDRLNCEQFPLVWTRDSVHDDSRSKT